MIKDQTNLSVCVPNLYHIKSSGSFIDFLNKQDAPQVLFILTPAIQKQFSFLPQHGTLISGYSFVKSDLDTQIKQLGNITHIVVVGAAKLVDQAKYLSAKLNLRLTIIPSILSTNAFATDRSVLLVDGRPTSVKSMAANAVYIFDDLLKLAPPKYNQYGLIDILSIFTAINDWDIAITAKKDQLAMEYFIAKAVLRSFLSSSSELSKDYFGTAKLLFLSGLIVSTYGDGRPESGSEHIVAKAIERRVSCFHAYSVSFGILAAMKLQGLWDEQVANLATSIPDWSSEYGKDILKQIEKSLVATDISPRSGRYTVLDQVSVRELTSSIEKVIGYLKS